MGASRHSLWEMGFRPFFLLGSFVAMILVLFWILHLRGFVAGVAANMMLWHAHEMVFGFSTAIVSGFLLTATQNWTGIRGVHGKRLQLLVGLWLLPRLLFFVPVVPGSVLGVLDLAFLPALSWALTPYLMKSGRNRVFFVLLAGLWMGNCLWHADVLGWADGTATTGLTLAIGILVLMMVLIGGRIIPFFTRNAISDARVRVHPLLEKSVIALTVLFVVFDTFFSGLVIMTPLVFLLFVLHLSRWLAWDPWSAKKTPILWILFLGYLWIVAGFLLKGLAAVGAVLPALATHSFTTGAMGVLIYGMVTRVSLGHTGRPIQAGPFVTAGYVLVNLAAFTRVFMPFLFPAWYHLILLISASLWVGAFGILVAVYAPVLLAPRGDGREG